MRLDGMGIGFGAAMLALALAAGPVLAQGTTDNAPASPPAAATPPAASPPATTPPAGAPGAPAAGPFVFASPPSAQANRIYSVNVRTGEVSACQFERPEGSLVGVTRCFRTDASAGPREPGPYDVVSTRYSGETGIFRVNAQTGQMSVCYVRDMPKDGGGVEPAVVCTAPSR
ncbi:hypothetical protein MWN33_17460 [Starkeya koreensis]|uniref:Uncharacterized protein n=1 Tax=Ancylobacter koreensis TaxID=266121 RepID=A0ABT0DRS2_9HYPH|nr:hypothetical protein [Ancylobacter koreensis]MCK0209822.1 hypothetical protein [Ancylobacter koreensis]